MLKHLYKTAFFLAVGFLSLQHSNAQCPSANTIVRNDTICTGLDSATVFLSDVKAGSYYKAYLADQIIDSALAKGTNLSLRISTKKLSVGKNKLTIKASFTGCGLVTLKDSAIININQVPRNDLVVIGDTICDNAAFATIKIYGTIKGQICNANITVMTVAQSIATGNITNLLVPRNTLRLGENKANIVVSISGCASIMLTNQATIMVQPQAMANLMVQGDTICSTSPFAKITIMPTNKFSKYELSNGSGSLMNPFYGDSTKNFTVKNIPTSLLAIGENTINVSTTFNMGVCGVFSMKAGAKILVHPAPELPILNLVGDTVFITDKFATIKIKNTEKYMPYSFSRVSRPDTTIFAVSDSIELKIPIGSPNGLSIGTHKIIINSSINGCTLVTSHDSTFVVVKPNPTTSIENNFNNSNFAVWPNPFISELYISSKLTRSAKIQIVDALGNVMHQQTISANEELKLNPDFKNGLYFLQMESDEKRELVKLIKQ